MYNSCVEQEKDVIIVRIYDTILLCSRHDNQNRKKKKKHVLKIIIYKSFLSFGVHKLKKIFKEKQFCLQTILNIKFIL